MATGLFSAAGSSKAPKCPHGPPGHHWALKTVTKGADKWYKKLYNFATEPLM